MMSGVNVCLLHGIRIGEPLLWCCMGVVDGLARTVSRFAPAFLMGTARLPLRTVRDSATFMSTLGRMIFKVS